MPTRPAAHRRSLDAAAPGLAPPQRCRARFALEMFPLTFRDEVQQYLGWREDPPDPLARAWKRGTVRQVLGVPRCHLQPRHWLTRAVERSTSANSPISSLPATPS